MLGKNYFLTKSVGFRHQTRGLGRMGIDKSLESRMKPVKSLAMKLNLNMRRIKGTKSSVLEYQDKSGYLRSASISKDTGSVLLLSCPL